MGSKRQIRRWRKCGRFILALTACEPPADATCFRIAPISVGHLIATGPEPTDVLYFVIAHLSAIEKRPAAQRGVPAKQASQITGEIQQD
jgi:hypothetical protein